MKKFDAFFKMFGRMTTYGLVLGAIAGFLVGVVLLMSDMTLIENIIGVIVLSALYGGMFGGIYGGLSGFFCAGAMVIVTAVAFREVRNVPRYKFVMGAITAVTTTGIFMLGGLWEFGYGIELTWASAMVMSVVIAVYASQIVARKYVTDISVKKKKIEA